MKQLGDYLIHRILGTGGMGTVYEAEALLSHRRVALKVLKEEHLKKDAARERFLVEMTVLANLNHPCIVQSLFEGVLDDQLVIVMEYLDGLNLRTVLQTEGRLPFRKAVGIAIDVASALAYAHERTPPIVHRDLKPENIMILKNGSAKVMDFGIVIELGTHNLYQ